MAKKVSKFSKGLKARQEKQVQAASGGTGFFRADAKFKRWNPSKGDHFIDVVPYYGGKNDSKESQEEGTYMYSLAVHKRVGIENQSFVCPKVNGLGDKKCPICEYRKMLKDRGEEWEVWKEYLPQKRELYNIICMDSEKEAEKGVQVFDVAYFYMGKFLEPIMQNPVRPGMKESDAYIQFALETEDGKTVGFRVGEKKTGDQTFPEYSGHRFVDRDYDIEEFLDDAHTLDELIKVPTYKEIYEAHFDEEMPDGEEKEKSFKPTKKKKKDVEETEEKETKRKSKKKKAAKEVEETEDVEEAEEVEDVEETEEVEETGNKFKDIDTDEMDTKSLEKFIKKNKIPLDDEIGEDLNDYDEEDLRFLVEDWIENQG